MQAQVWNMFLIVANLEYDVDDWMPRVGSGAHDPHAITSQRSAAKQKPRFGCFSET